MGLKIDLHVHTCYSHDGISTPKEILAFSKKVGLDGVAITDHNVLSGALKLQKRGIIVISGMEIDTKCGHVLALNVNTPIPSKLSINQTIEKIHEAGGIAIAAHPSLYLKRSLNLLTAPFDAVEVINSAAIPYHVATYLNRKIATYMKLPQTAGSDSHYIEELGMAYTIIEADPNTDEIVETIRKGGTIPVGKPIPWRIRLKRMALSLKRKVQ